jgi:hypothetical protein
MLMRPKAKTAEAKAKALRKANVKKRKQPTTKQRNAWAHAHFIIHHDTAADAAEFLKHNHNAANISKETQDELKQMCPNYSETPSSYSTTPTTHSLRGIVCTDMPSSTAEEALNMANGIYCRLNNRTTNRLNNRTAHHSCADPGAPDTTVQIGAVQVDAATSSSSVSDSDSSNNSEDSSSLDMSAATSSLGMTTVAAQHTMIRRNATHQAMKALPTWEEAKAAVFSSSEDSSSLDMTVTTPSKIAKSDIWAAPALTPSQLSAKSDVWAAPAPTPSQLSDIWAEPAPIPDSPDMTTDSRDSFANTNDKSKIESPTNTHNTNTQPTAPPFTLQLSPIQPDPKHHLFDPYYFDIYSHPNTLNDTYNL